MIGVRRTKIWREISAYKARTLLAVLAIAVGVGAFGLMNAGRTILERDMQGGFAASAPAHAVLLLDAFDDALVTQVSAMPDVAAAASRRAVPARILVAPNTWVTLDMQAARNWEAQPISRIVPEPDSPAQPPSDTLLLERSSAKQFGFTIGQTARVQLVNGTEHDLTISGLVSDQAITPSNINTTTAYGYVTLDTLSALGEPTTYNRLLVRWSGNRAVWADVEPAATALARALTDSGNSVRGVILPKPGKPPLWDTMNGVLFILGTMGQLTLALSGLLIINVMWAVITRQIPQIGVIKSLGGRRGQIMRLYLEMVLIFGLLALVLALPLALGGAYGLATGVGSTLNVSVTGIGLPLNTLITLIVAALLVPTLAALVPVLTGARITIREAISGRPEGKPGRVMMQRMQARLPTLLVVSIRNTFRRAGRVALTIIALSVAGAMFIAVLGVYQSLQQTALAIQAETNYDVEVNFVQPYPAADLVQAARKTPGVTTAEAWGVADARRVFGPDRLGGSLLLIGLPPDTHMSLPSVTEGRRLQGGDTGALFVNADARDLLQTVQVGDELTVRVGANDQQWQVIGVSARGYVPIAYVSYADFERVTGMSGYAGRLVARTTSSSAAEQASVQAALLKQLHADGFTVSRSSTTAENRRSIAANLDTIAIMLLTMVALVALVGGLGLASTMGINVLERTREIGVLRSLGARAPVVRRVVLVEGLVIGLLSAIFGTLGSVPLGMWLANQLGPRILYQPLDFVFAWSGALLWLGLVAVIAIVASLAPAQAAARLTIRETLAYDG